jgi:predicted permease
LGLAVLGTALFRRFGPSSIPLMADVAMNPRVGAAGVLLSILVGLAIGVVPAIRGGGVDLLSSLRSSALAVTSSGSRMSATLAATQLALALILGVGAILLFRSFVHITSQPLGFRPERIVSFTVPFKKQSPWETWDRLVESLGTLPGVASAAIASNVPLQTPGWMPRVQSAEQADEASSAGIPGYVVTPGYFDTMGMRLAGGRSFGPTDQPESAPVAIVNHTFATTVLGGRNPIGARITILNESGREEREVVGVVADAVQARIQDGIAPAIYVPHTQHAAIANVVLETSRAANPDAFTREVRRALTEAGLPMLPLLNFGSLSSRIAAAHVTPRFNALLIGAFATAAILLSAVGLYGTLAFAVRSRRKELGIRIALGAAPRQIHAIVVRQSLRIFAVGGVTGLIGAMAVTRLLDGYLYRLSTIDPVSFLAAIGVAGGVVLAAALRPAVRAGQIDPMTSIRVET